MTSTSQPSGFAAYFAAQPSTSSAPLIHGLTSPPRTDSPSDSKIESRKDSVSESTAPAAYGNASPIPTPPTHTPAAKKAVDISTYTKRAWRLVHDPELHPKGSAGRSKPKEIRQSGHGVYAVSDPRKLQLSYGANTSKRRKKYTSILQKPQYQYDANSVGPPPASQVVIWGFPPIVTAENIQTHFRPFGEIQELDFKVDSASGASLGVCRIKYKVDKKDMMSGHNSAKKAAQDGVKVRLGGSFVQVEMDSDGLKTVRRVGEAIKRRHAEQAAQIAARERDEKAAAAKSNPPPTPKPIPTGPAADRKPQTPIAPISHPPPPPLPNSLPVPTDRQRMNSDARRSIDSRTPLHESSRSRRPSPSPPRDRHKSISDPRYGERSPGDRSRPRERSRSRERPRYRSPSPDRSRPRSRSRGRDDYRSRRRSPSRSRSRSLDRRRGRDDRRYSPPRRSDSRGRDTRHRRRSPSSDLSRERDRSRDRRRSLTPRKLRALDDRPLPSAEKFPPPPSSIDEYRPAYSSRFRPGVDDKDPPRDRKARDLTPPSPPRRHRTPGSSERDEERGRTRKRSPPPRTRTPSSSRSPIGRRRRPASSSESRSRSRTSRIPLLSSAISHKLGGRPYIFISDRDLPVRTFSSRDLGLCFKKFHPSVYDDSHGFYIAFHNYQDARDCHAAHGDGKSFIDGYRLRMTLIDDKETIRASKSAASPTRRKPPPKKTVEEEAADIIMAELKEVFMKDVRSRIVNPLLFDLLDPSHYKDIKPKQETPQKVETVKILRPDPKVQVTPTKREVKETPVMTKTSITNLLPRFRKKGAETAKTEGRDRKVTKADVRPMHHQFNHYSDSEEDEDELPQREATVASDDEDESSRPSRETTTLSTPEPSRVKGLAKSVVKVKGVTPAKEEESEEELLKDILDTTKEEVQKSTSKRKRIVDFTSSEDEEDEPSPSKKICVEPEIPETMQIDAEVVAPKLSRAALLKAAKAKAALLRRQKKEAQVKEIEDSITIETAPVTEVKESEAPAAKRKVPDVDLSEVEDEDDLLLDLDGVQALVRDKEDYRFLLEAMVDITPEPITDIWTWSWKQKKLKSLNFDGAFGPIKKPETPSYNRINSTGSARTEGYIKIPEAEKSLYLPQRNKAIIPIGSEAARKTSRMNRVNNRRLAADMEVQKKTLATESDILRFNQLKARKKQLKFARSPIHDWGLFAMEDIEAHEMVIEYVGEIIRFQVAELREKQYERVGIGSSYLFRVDDENIIDATKTGNIARFINHCCTPNCSAKIIQVQGEKKIVIYADRFIGAGEEITYDYKFPREDVKIPCFCGSAHCKGTLN